MSWTTEACQQSDMVERDFLLEVDDHKVPGVYWQPVTGAQRLVLLGHGGTTHKKVEYIAQVATMLGQRGIAALAIDGPGHGARVAERWEDDPTRFPAMWHSEGGTQTVIRDWAAALDFIEAEQGQRPTGWWGLSMGTMMGLPVTASDPRITVALLGLMGTWGPNSDDLRRLAEKVTCPVRFLVQWDDEVVPRDDCFELFGLLGTRKKTMHVNPGAHAEVPAFEIAGSVAYLDRHLGA